MKIINKCSNFLEKMEQFKKSKKEESVYVGDFLMKEFGISGFYKWPKGHLEIGFPVYEKDRNEVESLFKEYITDIDDLTKGKLTFDPEHGFIGVMAHGMLPLNDSITDCGIDDESNRYWNILNSKY